MMIVQSSYHGSRSVEPRPWLRLAFAIAAVAAAALSAGYWLQAPWAVSTWPWIDGRLSNLFVSSILAAIALPLLWIGYSGQVAGTAGGFVHLAVILGGAASVLFPLAASRPADALTRYAAGAALGAIACVALAWWSYGQRVRDERPLTAAMRVWFVVYILILIPSGIALMRGAPGIMPWPLKPETSALYGWIFVAAVCSFVYPLLRPRVENATVGLLGFLAYDAVLIGPFIGHFKTVKPELATTLTVYTSVLLLTGLVSIWYLFVSARTRIVLRNG